MALREPDTVEKPFPSHIVRGNKKYKQKVFISLDTDT